MKITAVADKRMFCLYAALNAVGYDLENKPPMHPVRILVRDYLANLDLDLTDLQDISKKYESNHYYNLRTWILYHGEPPEFPEINPDWKFKVPTDVDVSRNILGDFWIKSKLEVIWKKVLLEYQKAVIDLEKLGREAVDKVSNYLKTDVLGIKEFVIIPNFLESHSLGIGPTVGQTAFAILGPQPKDKFALTRVMHEFLHSVINPLTESYNPKLRSRLREYLIRAMVLRMNLTNEEYYISCREKHIQRGYGQIDQWLDWLKEFELDKRPFDQYLQDTKCPLID